MPEKSLFDPQLLKWCRWISLGISIFLTISMGGIFFSWFFGFQFHEGIGVTNYYLLPEITAVAFILIGLSLFFLHFSKTITLGRVLGGILFLSSVFFFFDNYKDLHFTQILLQTNVSDPSHTSYWIVPMSYLTSLVVFCTGLALFLQPSRAPGVYRIAELLAIFIGGTSLVVLYAYAFDLVEHFQIQLKIFPRYFVCLLFGLSATALLLLRPTEGLMSIATNNTLGGYTVRRLIFIPIVTPFLTSFLRSIGEYLFRWDPAILFAAGIFFNMTILTAVILYYGKSLWLSDLKQRASLEAEIKLNEQIADLTRSQTELEQTKLFSFTSTHDLQEPVHKILLYKSLLKADLEKNDYASANSHFETLEKATQELGELIQVVHNYASLLIEGKPFAEVDLNRILENAKNQLQSRIRETNAKIIAEKLPVVFGDEDQLKSVFLNIIENSLIFHREGVPPVIVISEHLDEGILTITFQDNGIGMAEEHIPKLWQPFYRIHPKSFYSGKGLGLPICKKILQRHGGFIDVSSELGVGTTVAIRIPLRAKDLLEH